MRPADDRDLHSDPPNTPLSPALPLDSESIYRQVVHSVPAAMYTTDSAGRITMFNAAAVALWGRRPEPGDLWCGSWRIFRTDGSPLPLDQCPMAVTLREGRPVVGEEIVVERPDGERRHVLPHPQPLFDADGVQIGAVNMLIDITDRKRTEATLHSKERELEFVTGATSLILVRCSSDLRYQFVNPAAAALFNLTPEDMVGRAIVDVMGEAALAVIRPRIDQVLRGERVEYETDIPYPTGTRRMHVTYVPDRDATGQVIGWVASIVDVTDRFHAEEALRLSEERYRAIVESQSEMICRFRPDGTILFVNGAYARARGVSIESLIGTSFWEFITPEDRLAVHELLGRLHPDRPEMLAENRFETTTGTRWTLWTNRAIAFDAAGRPTEVQSAGIDITDRKRAEQALLAREEYLRAVIETSPECVKVIAPDGTLEYMNPAGLSMVEAQSPAEVQGRSVFDLIAPEHRDAFRDFHARVCAGAKASLEFEIIGLRGTRRHMQANAVPLAGPDGRTSHLALTRDVSERWRAESVRSCLAAVVESTEDAVISKNLDGRITSWNAGAERMFGYTAAEAVGKPITMIIPASLQDEERAIIARLRAGERIEHFETVRVAKDGQVIDISLTVSPVRDAAGRIIGASKVARNTTERRRAQEALRESDRRLRLALEAGRMGSWEWSLETNKVTWSPSLEALHGLEPGTFPGTFEAFQNDVHPEDLDRLRAQIARSLETGDEHHIEYRIIRPDGQIRWVEGRGAVIKNPSGAPLGMVGVCADITARKQAELDLVRHQSELEHRVEERTRELSATYQRLRVSERMAMMGTLSAGLGHDMGNLLVPIRIRLESLTNQIESQQGKEDLDAIRSSVEYLRRLASGLRLLVVEPSPPQSGQSTSLAPWWADAQGVLTSVLPRGVALTARIPDLDVSVRISKAALTQVVFNLVQNAGDAMKDRGQGQVSIDTHVEGDTVIFSVTDNGPGMSAEVQARCMEPYFTTKTRGISTGLGLVLVYGLVRDAGGSVELRSDPGKGTSFALKLPLVRPAHELEAPLHKAVVDIRDARLRSFLAGELRSLRFDVDKNANGSAALYVLDNQQALDAVPEGTVVVFLGEAPGRSAPVRAVGAKPSIWEIRDAIREAARSIRPPLLIQTIAQPVEIR